MLMLPDTLSALNRMITEAIALLEIASSKTHLFTLQTLFRYNNITAAFKKKQAYTNPNLIESILIAYGKRSQSSILRFAS